MGVLLIYPLIALCWLVPAWLIFRSSPVHGWHKAGWVAGCLASALLPGLLVAIAIAVAVHAFGYQRDLKAVMFGPEAIAMSVASVASLGLPWMVYRMFRRRWLGKS